MTGPPHLGRAAAAPGVRGRCRCARPWWGDPVAELAGLSIPTVIVVAATGRPARPLRAHPPRRVAGPSHGGSAGPASGAGAAGRPRHPLATRIAWVRWATKSRSRHLAEALARRASGPTTPSAGCSSSRNGCSAPCMTLRDAPAPGRDAQLWVPQRAGPRAPAAGQPVVSVDTKQQDWLMSTVVEWSAVRRAWSGRCDDFPIQVGMAIPYGSMTWAPTRLVSVDRGHDTAASRWRRATLVERVGRSSTGRHRRGHR